MAIERRQMAVSPLSELTSRPDRVVRLLARDTMRRVAQVQSESIVQTEKMHEVDHLAREAMTGQAMLRHWAHTVSAGDPLLIDELDYFVGLARVGKAEIIADTISTYCRESRGV